MSEVPMLKDVKAGNALGWKLCAKCFGTGKDVHLNLETYQNEVQTCTVCLGVRVVQQV